MFIKRNTILKYCVLIFSMVIFSVTLASFTELDDVLAGIRKIYDVEHISNDKFKNMVDEDMVVFDVRELKEYQVSHLENAIYLNPSTSSSEFFELYGDQLKGKVAVFYCSVGLRSSKMLSMLQKELPLTTMSQAYNLDGGAFKWHNDNIALTKDGKLTSDIHPYNSYWGRLLNDKSAIKYKN